MKADTIPSTVIPTQRVCSSCQRRSSSHAFPSGSAALGRTERRFAARRDGIRIHADDGPTGLQKLAALPGDVTHLLIPFRVVMTAQELAIGPQSIALEMEQSGDGGMPHLELAAQASGQLAPRLAGPLETRD